jgi:hypothetical protein
MMKLFSLKFVAKGGRGRRKRRRKVGRKRGERRGIFVVNKSSRKAS